MPNNNRIGKSRSAFCTDPPLAYFVPDSSLRHKRANAGGSLPNLCRDGECARWEKGSLASLHRDVPQAERHELRSAVGIDQPQMPFFT